MEKIEGLGGREAVFVIVLQGLKLRLNSRCFLSPNNPLYLTDQVQFLLIRES